MERRVLAVITGVLFLVTTLMQTAALGLDGPYPLPQAPDPGAGVSMLTDASANEGGAAAPFMGLASRIEADPLFGTAASTIPIELPSGRKMTPDLTIRYSSNAGNGTLGVGWDLPLGSIRRNIARGVPFDYAASPPVYTDQNGFVLTFRGGTIILDACQDPPSCNYWNASSEEAWLSAQFFRTSNYWEVTSKDGTKYTYGAVAKARTGRSVYTALSASTTFGWHLTDLKDPNGNAIHVDYEAYDNKFSTTGENPASYPTRVDYGENLIAGFAHIFHVTLTYESQPRPDVVTTFRGGFEEKISRRLLTISMAVDGAAANPTRQYQFSYTQDPDSGLSLLSSVAAVPASGSGTPPPPATTFLYTTGARRLDAAAALTFPNGAPPLPRVSVSGFAGTTMGFLDVDSDGLPDLFDGYYPQGIGVNLYRNRGGLRFDKEMANGGIWTTLLRGLADYFWFTSPLGRLIDMDGDGLLDVLVRPDACGTCPSPPCPSTCTWEFYRNIGDRRVRSGVLQTATGSWQNAPFRAPIVSDVTNQLTDLTGDGLPDALYCPSETSQSCDFYRNVGAGGGSTGSFAAKVTWSVPAANDVVCMPPACPESWRGPLATVDGAVFHTIKQVMDINGDGLPDLVSSRPWSAGQTCVGGTNAGAACTSGGQCPGGACAGHWDVWFGTGTGFAALTAWPAPPFNSTAAPYAIQDGQTGVFRALRDMNGDGLLDYVDATTSPWTVYLNTGAAFSRTPLLWDGTQGLSFISYNSGGAGTSDVFDANGDGLADHVSLSNGIYYARQGVKPRGNLLKKQENGLGASVEVTSYVPSTDPATAGSGCAGGTNVGAPCMTNADCPASTCTAPCATCSQLPFPTWVVQTVTTHSGFSGPGNDLTTQFTFTSGYFDPVGHQFRGFRQSMETRSEDGRKIRRQFAAPPFATSTSPPWPASVPARPFKLIDEQVLDSTGKVLSRTTVDWDAANKGNGRYQLHPTKRIDTTYSTVGSTTVTRTQTFDSYDDFNNVTSDTVSGDGVPSSIVTTTAYGGPLPCRAQPTQSVVSSGTFAYAEKHFTYDTKCNLLTTWARLAPAGQSATTGTAVTTTTLEYDQSIDSAAAKAGQPTRIKDALNNATTLNYSCSNGIFPCTITNALNQVTQKTYDLRWGKPLSITEPNTAVTSFTYDGLGRLASMTRPLDTTPWRQFVYTFGTAPTPTRIDTLVREPNATGGTRTISSFYDSLGRMLETKQQQYVGGAATVVVRDAPDFDTAGRVAKRYIPFSTATAVTTYTAPLTSTNGTTFSYDALDRVTRTTNPNGTYRTADYTVAGQTTALDENYTECATPTGKTASCPGSKTVEFRDALGRVTKTELSEGTTLKTRTTTAYDGLNRVTNTTVTDPGTGKTAPTDFQYDSFSRRTAMIDADSGPAGSRGTWTYTYDNAGNLLYQNDPKGGQHLEFCYDALNRVARKLYFSNDNAWSGANCTPSITPPRPYLQYAYDAQTPYGCTNTGIGRLCAVGEYLADSDVTTVYIYDPRGRVNREYGSRSMLGKSGSYTRTDTYDVADRLISVAYPTNFSATSETVQYLYNDLGQLDSLYSGQQTYANGLTYDIFGRTTLWKTGSDLRNTATYASSSFNFRLTQLKVADAGGTVYQQFDYGTNYDVAGNLRTLTDNTPTTRYASTSPLRNSWTYLYDGLSRLKSAQLGSAAATPFTYDGLGNMLTGNQLTFAYTDATHAHHMTSLTPGGSVSYHDDGGLSARGDTDGVNPDTSRTITYNADGRLDTVNTGDGHTVRSIYDFRGERVARVVDGSLLTFYYGRWFEVTGGTLTRHMYLGDRLIADSPVAAPTGLTLASISPEERSLLLARAMRDTLRWSPQLYPGYELTAEEAAKLGALVLFVLLVVGCAPGRVRVGLAVARSSPFRRLRRGHVIVVIIIFSLSLTPLTCLRSAHAGGSGGPPPPGTVFPVYFIHTDHLGSTVMLTCYKQGSCADRAVIRYFRYDAYGQMKAYDVNGTLQARGAELTERLYTGQRWDWQAQVYYYGARFYDPKVASFLSEDPVREYMNPYAYVGWNPVMLTDPTGRLGEGIGGLAGLEIAMALAACGGGCSAPAAAAALAASVAAGAGQFATSGGTTSANPLATSIQSMVIANIVASIASAAGEMPGSSFTEGVAQALGASQSVDVNFHGGGSLGVGQVGSPAIMGISLGATVAGDSGVDAGLGLTTIEAAGGFGPAASLAGPGSPGLRPAALGNVGARVALGIASAEIAETGTFIMVGGTILLAAGGPAGIVGGTFVVLIGGALNVTAVAVFAEAVSPGSVSGPLGITPTR